MNTTARRVWLVVGLVAAAALAACGGNDENIPIDAAVAVDAVDAAPAVDAIDAMAEPLMCVTSVANLTVTEGASATFTVMLSGQPTAATVLNIASADATAATATPTALTFTSANFNIPQIVTVAGVDDADPNDETTSVTCAGTGIPVATVAVTVADDDD